MTTTDIIATPRQVADAVRRHSARWYASLQHPVTLVALGMVLLQLLHRGWLLQRNWFYADDYFLLRDAQESGLTLDYLLTPENGHFMPATRFLYWVVEFSGELNWPLAVAITLGLQLLASLGCLWMLVTLFGHRYAVLAPLALYLTSAITAQATLWWISAVNQISIQAAFFVALGCWVQYLRTRSYAWLALTALAVVWGLLFFQKILLVLPVLIFVGLVYFARRPWYRGVAGFFRDYWPSAVVLGLLGGGFLTYSFLTVEQPLTEGNVHVMPVALRLLTSTVIGAAGGPWIWEWQAGGSAPAAPPWLQVVVGMAALGAIAVTVVLRRFCWPAWALLAGYGAMLIPLVATSRAQTLGEDIASSYRFQTEVVCVLVLALGLVFLPMLGARRTSGPRPGREGWSRRLRRSALAATTAISISGTVSWGLYEAQWQAHNDSRGYLTALSRNLHRAEPVHLANDAVPAVVMPRFYYPSNLLESLTPLIDAEVSYPEATPSLSTVDQWGQLHQATIKPATRSQEGPQPHCGWLAESSPVTIPLRTPTYDYVWWVRISYLADTRDEIVVDIGSDRFETTVLAGTNSLFVKSRGRMGAVTLLDIDQGTSICVDAVEVGTITSGPSQ